jgi:hypothetical protein
VSLYEGFETSRTHKYFTSEALVLRINIPHLHRSNIGIQLYTSIISHLHRSNIHRVVGVEVFDADNTLQNHNHHQQPPVLTEAPFFAGGDHFVPLGDGWDLVGL